MAAAGDPTGLSRRRFLRLVSLAAVAGPAGAYQWRSNALEVTRTTLVLPGAGPPLTIALLADVHAPQPGLDWQRVVDAVDAAQPDLVVIAGDAINARGDEGLLAMYAPLEARVAKVAVAGNWENWGRVRRSEMARQYTAGGVEWLDNRSLDLEGLGLHVIGLDERTNGWPDWDLVSAAPLDRPTVLVHHSPNAFDRLPLPPGAVVLQLSGHTHGGQIAPLGRPLILPPGTGPYVQGLFQRGAHRLYVTRGLGNSHLPFRLGARPELALLDIRRAGA